MVSEYVEAVVWCAAHYNESLLGLFVVAVIIGGMIGLLVGLGVGSNDNKARNLH